MPPKNYLILGMTRKQLIKLLEKASKTVSKWPAWQQELLGGTATKLNQTELETRK